LCNFSKLETYKLNKKEKMTEMSTKKIVALVSTAIAAMMLIIVFFMNISIENTEIDLRARTEAQNKKCEAYFDKMWKVLKQKAGVTDQYKDAFKEIYPKLIEGRYAKGDGSLMKWIQESNPTFDVSLYSSLMRSIEVERTGFFNEQSSLIDMQREHKVYLQKAPNRWFLDDNLKPVEIKVITSSKTDEVYRTGKEDDIDLY
jgi:hypothetical protein